MRTAVHDRRLRGSRSAAAALAVLALVAAGCGSSSSSSGIASESPNQIITSAKRAMSSLKSVRMVITNIPTANGRLDMDLSLVPHVGARGTFTIGGVPIQTVYVGGQLYMNAPAAFWRRFNPPIASLLSGRWIHAPMNSSLAAIVQLMNFTTAISRIPTGHDNVKLGTTTVNGQSAVKLKGKSSGTIGYVATQGKPYILEISIPSSHATMSFSQFDQPVSLKAPANVLKLPTGG